ncbi:MAG: RnfABCDGE type electron transport complex subunit B [Clostridia bacterium]|nr:RnfABCDGE type electron transport complex subunit B [Clostridia bacterium]
MNYTNVLIACGIFAALGGVLGLLLAIAGKVFAVKVDERVTKTRELLPGANCGGCGFAGCDAFAQAIVDGKANPSGCTSVDSDQIKKISEVCGVAAGPQIRKRAQVMCSGTNDKASKKYDYKGPMDCISVSRMGGGDKTCPNGCIGLGSCISACKFDAISIRNGVAVVDYNKCAGCGMCTYTCPKHIIKLIPFDAYHWVGCMSVDPGQKVRKYCEAGCISCRLCEKNCPTGAITVDNFIASIDYEKCDGCNKCVDVCPRKIIMNGYMYATVEDFSEMESE